MSANTLFLRLEGPMQAWGSHESKFVIRRVMDAPTKSGVIGLLLCALGVSREAARNEGWLTRLSALRMGVRMDRAGMRWWDYHTVGAGMKMRIASGGSKDGPILTRREYLCDASYLVALQGDTDFIAQLQDALVKPVWTLYLGRKCCVPSMPVFSEKVLPCSSHNTPLDALKSIPLFPRNDKEPQPEQVTCFLDWIPQREHDVAPADAQIWYDVPVSLDPPAHEPRFVIKQTLSVGENGGLTVSTAQIRKGAQSPPRPPRRLSKQRIPRHAHGTTGPRQTSLRLLQVLWHDGAAHHIQACGRSGENRRTPYTLPPVSRCRDDD
jgi:CRISPR system Cascade subunit CasD